MKSDSLIYVAGHRGLLGSAIVRKLKQQGFCNLLLKTSQELDLTKQTDVFDFLSIHRPEYMFISAAKVGGIRSNMNAPAEFLYVNLQIQNNLIAAAYKTGVKKILFVASSCIYPKDSTIPIQEDSLLSGPLEPTNEGYALAKIAGIKLCQYYRRQYGVNYISAIPPNLFGINDNYDINNSHLLPAIIHKIHLAKKENKKEIILWGSGKPRREFMLSDDCADGLLFLMNHYSGESPINLGTNKDHSVRELASVTAGILKFDLHIHFDTSQPDGMMRKLIDSSRVNALGWQSKISIEEGIEVAYKDYLGTYN
jgi:GDP-L-fucose synthase